MVLSHVDVTTVGADKVLFHQLRAAYNDASGDHRRNPFIVPRTVQYVKVCYPVRPRGSNPRCLPVQLTILSFPI